MTESKNMLKNDLLLKALRGETVERPPVWMMRQAGRYLPQYMRLKEKYDFFTRIQTPELACEITLQPIDIIGPDAAIIFSDILVIPQALGMEVLMEDGKGPLLPKTIQSKQDVDALLNEDIVSRLEYVCKAISLCKKELNNRVPLIGFAGAPFTILCYMVEGKGSKSFDKAKQFCFTQPALAHELLSKITTATIAYLKAQVASGADCVQVFDSWSGMLAPSDFDAFALPYLGQIADALSPLCPVILFPKGSWYALKQLSQTSASAIGIDWTIHPRFARRQTGYNLCLQGNFDPVKLLTTPAQIQLEVQQMIEAFGTQNYIANLGHGILPHVPVDNAKAFVDAVKNYAAK
jgi:uroporphyrinogen decarboxylase